MPSTQGPPMALVIDTNVLMKNRDIVDGLIKDAPGYGFEVIIPWAVLKQLDKIKRRGDETARAVTVWLNELMEVDQPAALRIQKRFEITQLGLLGRHAILDCCLYLNCREGQTVVLFSNSYDLSACAYFNGMLTIMDAPGLTSQTICEALQGQMKGDIVEDAREPKVTEMSPPNAAHELARSTSQVTVVPTTGLIDSMHNPYRPGGIRPGWSRPAVIRSCVRRNGLIRLAENRPTVSHAGVKKASRKPYPAVTMQPGAKLHRETTGLVDSLRDQNRNGVPSTGLIDSMHVPNRNGVPTTGLNGSLWHGPNRPGVIEASKSPYSARCVPLETMPHRETTDLGQLCRDARHVLVPNACALLDLRIRDVFSDLELEDFQYAGAPRDERDLSEAIKVFGVLALSEHLSGLQVERLVRTRLPSALATPSRDEVESFLTAWVAINVRLAGRDLPQFAQAANDANSTVMRYFV